MQQGRRRTRSTARRGAAAGQHEPEAARGAGDHRGDRRPATPSGPGTPPSGFSGCRLDTETQIRLSGQMRQLGLHELADALLGRARRRAGGQSSELVALMTQYQRQGKLEQAAQIAMQILRSSRGSLARPPESRSTRRQSRPAAMRVLAASGRLPKLIERTREQLKKTPNSVAIHQMLADYYTAARQSDLADVEMATNLELKPDDADLRLRLALHLAAAAIPPGPWAITRPSSRRTPISRPTGFSQMLQLSSERGKTAELVDVLTRSTTRRCALGVQLIARLLSSAPQIERQASKLRSCSAGVGGVPRAAVSLVGRRLSQ